MRGLSGCEFVTLVAAGAMASWPMTHDPDLTAGRMLMELDFPAGEDDRREILKRFADALEPIRRMLTEQSFNVTSDVHQRFAIIHLLARSLSDLLAGGHLAAHYYLPQAHSVFRPVIDSCDLMDLFADSPEQAEKWITTDRAQFDFAPSAVRQLLGRDKFDPIHGYFSESGVSSPVRRCAAQWGNFDQSK